MPVSLPTRLTAEAAEGAFGLLARARDARALHPKGVVLRATVELRAVPGVPALPEPREVSALLRVSKAIGTGRGVPDIMGVALRLCDLHGEGRHQDLLLASCPPPPAHLVLAPVRDAATAWYTSLLPYRVGERRRVVLARGLGDGRFGLSLAGLGRGQEPLGLATCGEPIPTEQVQRTRFDALLHCAPELRQDAGPLDEIRRRAYAGSRANAAG